ncbi:MAG: NADH-quinone oxidoreductase subunit C [Opitutaceae bacterium]
MPPLEEIRDRILAAVSSASVSIVQNTGVAAQHSLLVDRAHALAIARFLRDDPELRLDYCSNATGVDWLDREIVEKVKKTVPAADGSGTTDVEEKQTRIEPGFIEVVYHLYSMSAKHGPVVLRVRTGDRAGDATAPSLTPVWRSCEFQEREIFDLFGVTFEGHPDLRRILMWDEFAAHPMRKDYVEPDDSEWEPTAHARKAEG